MNKKSQKNGSYEMRQIKAVKKRRHPGRPKPNTPSTNRFRSSGGQICIYQTSRYNKPMPPTSVTNPNIFLFTGENIYMLEKTVEKARENFEQKHGDLNITILDNEDELTANSIINALKAAPFLGEKRLVIIKNFLRLGDSDDQDKVENFLQDLPESSVAFFYENPNVETKKRPKSTLKKTIEKRATSKSLPHPCRKKSSAGSRAVFKKVRSRSATLSLLK